MAENEKARPYIELWKELDDQFSSWKAQYKEITDYVLPRRGKYIDDGASAEGGEKRHSKIINEIATLALRFMAAGMHGGLTSPARKWFRLTLPQTGIPESSAAREWLQEVEDLIYLIYQKTNFYQTIHTIYEEEGGFGTGVLLQDEDAERVSRFTILTAGEYRIACNAFGEVDTLARLFFMTARQMEQRFGENRISRAVKDCLERTPNKYFKVLHVVQPNKDRDVTKSDSVNMPVKSVYLEYDGDQEILEEKGYNEFPLACARWSVIANEPYGVSPTMDMLGGVKMLQVMELDVAKALHKTLDPPMRVPTSYKDTLNTLPGGMNWVDPTSEDAVKPLYQINFDVQSTQAKIEKREQKIREGYYNDLFMMISQSPGIQPKNMLEIMELQEEKLIMLGPVIERQFTELLNPTMKRTYRIAGRMNLIPPPPPELQGQEMKVEYTSFLAQAQKRIGAQPITSTVAFIGSLLALDPKNPEPLDKLNRDEAIDHFADLAGAPAKAIRDKDGVAIIRQGRAEQAKMQQEMAMAESMATAAKGVKQLSGADTSGKNALTDLVNGQQGARQ